MTSIISAITSTTVKRRPKTDEEIEEEIMLFFELPRKNCQQIAPRLSTVKSEDSKIDRQNEYRMMLRMLHKAKIPNVEEKMRLLIDLDRSDYIVPHGEVSKKLYNNIVQQRNFDLYGRTMRRRQLYGQQERDMMQLAERMGIDYDSASTEVLDEVHVPDIFENATGDLKAPIISTDKFKIGTEEKYHPPVGLSANPEQPYKSYGNEIYFAYDGAWEKGKMSGKGYYKYDDGGHYRGFFTNNRQHGQGKAVYPVDCSYEGSWNQGRFGGGTGVQKCRDVSTYEGDFNAGRREGRGTIRYKSGLVYTGDFLDGKPHGRGKMSSELTGYSYEGTFNKGSIEGSGTLITPPPKCQRIVQYWSETTKETSLPTVVRRYLQEQEDLLYFQRRRDDELFAPLRGIRLNDYVSAVRTNLHEERQQEKRARRLAEQEKIREQKQKLMDARLKALAGADG